MFEEAIKSLQLLPTPSATEYGNNQSPSEGAAVRESLPRLVGKLLPTPTTADSRNSRNATANNGQGSTGHSGTTLSDVAYEWSGATTDPQSADGKPSTAQPPRPSLNPEFVEWMLGLPRGWSDPDCPLSAMAFRSSAGDSPANG